MEAAEDLFLAALKAREKAHAPYSNFAVGVAIRTESGAIFTGANMENQSYPEGWCAETTAIGHMLMAAKTPADKRIAEVAVAAELSPPITPCGGCRQRLREFSAPETLVHACNLDGPQASYTMAELLPAAFAFREDDA
ncbi:cytidine deaminase [Rhodovulum sp. DZ06]|uniref:cytidine deaminase n=1 Tax=Rhodovulum sp. DZ06 TaxID=3425126 RepID=UPI003D335915